MIAVAVLSGIGGCGRSSTAVTLAQMLAQRGRKIYLFETDPLNILSAQLGQPKWSDQGLFQLLDHQASLEELVHCVQENFHFLPFGQTDYAQSDELSTEICKQPTLLTNLISQSSIPDDAILIFDTPRLPSPWSEAILKISDLNLILMVPDAPSLLTIDKVLPSILSGRGASYFLMNRFKTNFVLHLDIWTMSKIKLSHRLIPFYLLEDQTLPEAFASGLSIQDYSPSSQLTEGYQKLTNWIDLEIG